MISVPDGSGSGFRRAWPASRSLRAMVARWGGNPDELTSFYVVADFRTPEARVFTRTDAALFVAAQLGWPWKVMGVAGVLPTALLDRLYDVVAPTRYRVFGRHELCMMPPAEFRGRFVE